ncbi:NBR1-Ig-like domain-containing protein [Marinospirillum alkaliphilum]|uniref:Cro/C1-type HTH DNA-binding domain-containing protein n=1 Tax=Marinospirillum alkaliphilum DSM 21637 TaxID=1122209 RepID=A0A1K1TW51_9GAMM|nr:NBR1-Ig-like domain-containing protein [Marinospirillum alkaliphilum]SFX04806.1 Cro/C1-type HTH DNA-binding domain-containing protein [Marinospirillum alkaliphilum DSM 21637]
MEQDLEAYIRQRCRKLKLSLSDLSRQAGISRQTLYECWSNNQSYPSLSTLVALSQVLEVHPLRLLQLVFQRTELPAAHHALPGDQSAFVDDVTVPDGEKLLTGQRFTKTWRLQNVGTVPWVDRQLACQDDDLLVFYGKGEQLKLAERLKPDMERLAIPETQPGQTVDLSVTFTTPSIPCTVISYWKMLKPDGSFAFPESTGLWTKVKVVGPTQAAGFNTDAWQEN